MKPFGSILEFTEQRNADLMAAYRRYVSSVPSVRVADAARAIVRMPSVRFWVSEERAAVVVSSHLAGHHPLDKMRPTKRAMFREIIRRVVSLRKCFPSASILELTTSVVHQPAPCFYMLPRSAMAVIYKIKNGYYTRYIRDARCRRSSKASR